MTYIAISVSFFIFFKVDTVSPFFAFVSAFLHMLTNEMESGVIDEFNFNGIIAK
jgi:hypothetical protein